MAKADHHGTSEKESKAWGSGQHANMPKEVRLDTYPKANEMGPESEDDTISRIDMETKQAKKQTSRYLSQQH
jgi:hypothetical protein